MPKNLKTLAFVTVCSLVPVSALEGQAAAVLPRPVIAAEYELARVGQGQLSYFGFSIYDASLWTSGGRFNGFVTGRPVALSLWYRRAFSDAELVAITRKAWHKLGFAATGRQAEWLANLERIWVDVAAGDNLTTVVIPGSETLFYDENGRLGRIADPLFGPAFLAIWLDPDSVVADLRVALLGGDREL
jgi:hypothetical protein